MPARPRDAASLILVTRAADGWRALTGLRRTASGWTLAFPQDVVRTEDADIAPLHPLSDTAREHAGAPADRAAALANAALRAAYEEAGVLSAWPAPRTDAAPRGSVWRRVREHRLAPDHGRLRVLCRAICPAEAKIRTHTRFFLLDAAHAPAALFRTPALSDVEWRTIGALARDAGDHAARIVLARLDDALGAPDAAVAAAAADPFLISYRGGRALVRSIAE